MAITTTVIPNPQNGLSNSNGVSNGTTSPVAETVKPLQTPGGADPAVSEREAALNAREQAIAAREAKYLAEMKKNQREKNGLGSKLTRLQELEKYHSENEKQKQLAKLNPTEFLKGIYGDDAYKLITDAQVNGVPPAQLIAGELQKLREEFQQTLDKKDKEAKELQTKQMQDEVEETRAEVAQSASEFYEANKKDYPVFAKLGDAKKVGEFLASHIETVFVKTGKLLGEKEAADAVENNILGLLDAAVGAEKYKDRLTAKTQGAKVQESSGVQGVPAANGAPGSTRRTLTNTMTASSSGKAPPRSDAERFQRSMEAFNAARKGNQS